jgi:hypothetical protein
MDDDLKRWKREIRPPHYSNITPTPNQSTPLTPIPYLTNTPPPSSEERWRSEGIQIGGPRSGRGVLGNWFDKDFDRHGPAGPTAFWKVSDYIDEDGKEEEEEQSEGSLGDEDSEGDEEYMSD